MSNSSLKCFNKGNRIWILKYPFQLQKTLIEILKKPENAQETKTYIHTLTFHQNAGRQCTVQALKPKSWPHKCQQDLAIIFHVCHRVFYFRVALTPSHPG